MKLINYLLYRFGFDNWLDFEIDTFGFMFSEEVINGAVILGFITSMVKKIFGINHFFLIAYAILIIFEWITGVIASIKKGEKYGSRKIGRIILKIATYSVPIYILNTFQKEVKFPEVMGYEIDPFVWLYWTVVLVIVWQLLVSLLENLEVLNFKYAKMLLMIINKNFYRKFDLNDDKKDNNDTDQKSGLNDDKKDKKDNNGTDRKFDSNDDKKDNENNNDTDQKSGLNDDNNNNNNNNNTDKTL